MSTPQNPAEPEVDSAAQPVNGAVAEPSAGTQLDGSATPAGGNPGEPKFDATAAPAPSAEPGMEPVAATEMSQEPAGKIEDESESVPEPGAPDAMARPEPPVGDEPDDGPAAEPEAGSEAHAEAEGASGPESGAEAEPGAGAGAESGAGAEPEADTRLESEAEAGSQEAAPVESVDGLVAEPSGGPVDEPADLARESADSVVDSLGGLVDELPAEAESPEAAASEPGEDEDEIEAEELPELTDDELENALEALLLVVDSPVEEDALATALGAPLARVTVALRRLAERYTEQQSGIDLRRAGGGWRYYTRDRYAPYVEKLLLDGQRAKLTRAALETLAVIAYRQPVTRARVAAVRGVNCDGVIRTLLARGLVEETGTDLETGGYLYRTTELFLERLGLSSLEDLPPIAPLLPEVDSIDDI